jgi:hypothetical protein
MPQVNERCQLSASSAYMLSYAQYSQPNTYMCSDCLRRHAAGRLTPVAVAFIHTWFDDISHSTPIVTVTTYVYSIPQLPSRLKVPSPYVASIQQAHLAKYAISHQHSARLCVCHSLLIQSAPCLVHCGLLSSCTMLKPGLEPIADEKVWSQHSIDLHVGTA